MKKVFTKGFFIVSTIILLLSITFPVLAQYTKTTLETGGLYTALAKDASNNVYVTRVKAGTGGATYEVVKYTNGTGVPVSIYSTLTHELEDFPWGLAVASNGDVYISTDFTVGGGAIIRLNAASAYAATTVQTGRYFTALAIDAANNLYAAEYNAGGGNYAIVKYSNPSAINSAGTMLYSGITSTAGVSYPTGIALAANGDIFVTDIFNIDGGLTYKGGIIKLTAPSYARTNLSTDTYATALYMDGAGDLYATENSGAGYKLHKYTGATGAPTAIYTPLHANGIYYPYGIAAINTNNIFVANGDDGTNGGEVMQLINISPPTTQAAGLTFSSISGYGATANWTNGNGTSRAVFVANVSSGSPAPVDGTPYTANTAFTSGTQIGATGWYCVYNGTGTSVSITGLSPGNTYRVMTVEYNGTGATSHYLTTTATDNPANVQTLTLVDVGVTSTTSVTSYTPGTNITQTITVNNYGPNNVTGETVANSLLAGSTWTAVFTGGATGTLSGVGGINELVNLPFNGKVVYTATIPIPINQTGQLTLTTTVTAPVGILDVTLANNQDANTLQPPPISATTSQVNVSCNGANNGSASVVASGGTPGYTYSWAPSGGSAATATGLAPGTYTVTITDANAASITKSFTITEPTVLTASIGGQSNVSCNGGANGTATVSVTGGTPGYTYSWAPSGGTTSSAVGLVAGTYTVTVTDANGCTATQSFIISQPPVLLASIGSQTDVSCNGGANGTATVSVTGGTGAYSYVWAPSGGTTATASGLQAGTYTVTVTDANGCIALQSFIIGQPAALVASAGVQTNVSCNGGSNGSATVNVTGGTGTYTYLWAPSGGTGATATGLQAGNYTVTVKDANLCSTTQSFLITQPPALNTSAGVQTNVACNGGANGTATVIVSGGTPGYTYSWAPSGGSAATATGLTVGTYIVTVTDANGCIKTQSFTITQPPILSATTSQIDVSCNGGANGAASVTVSGGTPGYTYLWAPSGGTSSSATSLAAGTYTVTITDANACSITKTFTIGQPPVLTASFGAQTNVSCNGGSNGSATVSVSGGTSGYTYSWAPLGGTAATASGLSAGTYTVTVTDGNGCTALQSFTITAPAAVSIAPTTLPTSNVGTPYNSSLSATGGSGTYTYSITAGALPTGLTLGSATGSISGTPTAGGTYNFTVTATESGCNQTGSRAYTVLINKNNQTITFASLPGKIYGDADFSAGATSDNLSLPITYASSDPTVATINGAGSIHILKAGTTIITASQAGDAAYNDATDKQQTLTIAPKAITLTADAKSKIYGDADPALTYTFSPALVTGDVFTGVLSRAAGSDVGAYTINQNTLALSANYSLTYIGADFNITPKAITGAFTASNKTYDGTTTASILTRSLIGVLPGDVANVTLTGGTATFANADVGAAKVVTQAGMTLTGTKALNYNLTSVANTTADITVKAITGTFTVGNKPYDGNTTATILTRSLTGVVPGDVADVALTGGTATFADANVGIAKVVTAVGMTLTGAKALNYNLTGVSTATANITALSITVTADAKSKIYGNADPALTYTFSPALVTGDVFTGVLSRAAGSDVGTYAINQNTLALTANYSLTYIGADFSITPKAITGTFTASNKTYDGTTTASILTRSLVGVLPGDVANVALIGGTATFANANTGTAKVVTATGMTLTGTKALNYNLTSVANTTADINAKTITGTFTVGNKPYDGNTTATILTRSLIGVLPGDVADVVMTGGTATFADPNVGTAKAVDQTGMSLTGIKALNYNLTGVSLTTANITALSIIVTADAKSKVYGDVDPALTYVSSPALVTGDVFTGTLSRTPGNNVGTYSINQNTLALNSNYLLTYQQANFVINKKALIITADNKTKLQGAANPILTASYNGFVNGENSTVLTAQPLLSTTATINSLPGNYPISASSAAANNYVISYNDGVLSVGASVITAITLTPTTLYENNLDNALAGTFATTASDPAGIYTYTLVSGAGSTDNAKFNIAGNTVRATNSLNFEAQSVYNIRVKTTSQYGVSFEQTLTVSLTDVNEAPTLALITNQQICYTTAVQNVVLSGITAGPETAQTTTLSVSSNNGALFESLTVSNGSVSYKVKSGASGTAIITVMVTDNGGTANGGVDTYARTFTINVSPLPNVAITSDKGTEVSKGEIIKLTATGGVSYVWKADNSILSGQNTATLTVRPAINTTYTVTATNSNGCSQTSDFTINVASDFAKIKITNLLTPNGDGFNDKWIVENIDLYPNNEVKIFDRAGRLVYAKKVYDNSWDGRLNGSPLNENTYYYVVDFGPSFKKLKGYITIVRE